MKHLLQQSCAAVLFCFTSLALADTAIFAGGCFWCSESDFEKLDGVNDVTSGYTGGHVKNPDYKQVSHGDTGHYESVRVDYDPGKISYQQLLDYYWKTIDPFDAIGQFCDKGDSYRSAIFVTKEQKVKALASKEVMQKSYPDQKVATAIIDVSVFYPAEDYHQDYYKKNPTRYQYYRWRCGRDERLESLWGTSSATH